MENIKKTVGDLKLGDPLYSVKIAISSPSFGTIEKIKVIRLELVQSKISVNSSNACNLDDIDTYANTFIDKADAEKYRDDIVNKHIESLRKEFEARESFYKQLLTKKDE